MNQTAKIVAAVMWTAAFSLGVVGTYEGAQAVRFWALMLALVACCLTAQLIVCHAVHTERVRLERLIDGMVAQARERAEADLPRLR